MDIYKDIESRTKGEIYIGVVGPVRTGKSTFIKKFMEMMVIPSIVDENDRNRALDELPQSGSGKMVMTTEPKFIPKEAVKIHTGNDVMLSLRLIDCVGYMVDGATGDTEDGEERLIKTPWYDYSIPFTKAAEIGTQKVIYDHSTIGIIMSTDGSITDIDRNSYKEAEKRVIEELKTLNKPFIMILNSTHPYSNETKELADEISKEHNITVLPLNCDQLKQSDIDTIFEQLLYCFPVSCVNFNIPKWLEAMEDDNKIKEYLINKTSILFSKMFYLKDIKNFDVNEDEYIENIYIENFNLGDGTVNINVDIVNTYYYEMLSELLNVNIQSEYDFMKEIKQLASTKAESKKISEALQQTIKTGYGSVTPDDSEIILEKPELIHTGSKYGVKIKAKAPSIHLIKANVTTEIAPILGSEDQARDLIKYIGDDSDNPQDIWDVNIFGKTVKELVEDGLKTKINKINQESQQKLQETMEKIVNDSNGGMICIII